MLRAATQDVWAQANECAGAWGELGAKAPTAAAGDLGGRHLCLPPLCMLMPSQPLSASVLVHISLFSPCWCWWEPFCRLQQMRKQDLKEQIYQQSPHIG